MLRIGEFSRLCKVTVKTLRYYDEIGLLVPDHVADNGYRYYAYNKLVIVSRIQKMKEAGLYLEDIRRILGENLSAEERLELLKDRKKELIGEILSQKRTLSKLDQMICLAREERSVEKVILKSLPEVIVASYRTTIPSYDSLFKVAPEMGEKMGKQGAVCIDPPYCFNIYHDEEYCEKDIDVEICEAVEKACQDSEGIVYKKIAAVAEAATILHRGPYEGLGKSYADLFGWLEENGYKPSDKPRESFIDGIWNKQDPEEWLTEIQIPITKV
ncbi:MAG: MerR family transcriptional regulator [Chitinispirillaceae bacterium]